MIALPVSGLDPAEAARRAVAAPAAFWLSAPAEDEVGIARDFVGAAPVRVVRGDSADDLDSLEQAWSESRAAWASSDAPPAGIPIGVGWLSYDLGRALVGLPALPVAWEPASSARRVPSREGWNPLRVPDQLPGWPLLEFHFHDAVWVRRASGEATIFAVDRRAANRLAETLARPLARSFDTATFARLTAEHPNAIYLDGVRRVLDYLAAGDAYQVNLSRRLRAPAGAGDPVWIASALRARAPAPFASFITAADGTGCIVGNSPERFLAVGVDGTIETRPIKGTSPRGETPEADAAAAVALAGSAKDQAEHVMIVDLERNDLGRVCRIGSVEVASLRRLISLPTVHHLVSTVCGVLRPRVGLRELMSAMFPGGSITGAPKRRAMQIIDELEPSPRGPYTGATGWLGAAGDLDLAIAIRSALVRGGELSVSVGGGIVADSTPDAELAETEVKARAFADLWR